jgi:hypothetical protein
MAVIGWTHSETGRTLYAHFVSANLGTIWNGAALETITSANWDNYDVAATEIGTAYWYQATIPALAAGDYEVRFYRQAGAAVAIATDIYLGSKFFQWDGSAILIGATRAYEADLVKIHGTALTETAGQLAGAFIKFFNVAAPTATALSLPDAVPGAANGVFIAGTNAATVITTSLTTHLVGTVDTVTTVTGGATATNVTDAVTALATAHGAGSWATATSVTVSDKTGFSLSAIGADLILKTSTFALAMADAVWDESGTGHAVAGTMATYLEDAYWNVVNCYGVLLDWVDGGRLDLLLDAVSAADPLLNAVPGTYGAGTAGYYLGHLPSSTPINQKFIVVEQRTT